MHATHYQTRAARTLPDNPLILHPHKGEDLRLVMAALGLVDEAGEVAGVIKKAVFHGHELDTAHLRKEIGDTAWYLAALCTVAGISLAEVMRENIAKLETRYPQGFSSEDSIARRDMAHSEGINGQAD